MEDLKIDINKLNKATEPAADLPEVPRDENGKILIDQIKIDQDEKNNIIIPDKIFDIYYKELPPGIINQSKTWRTTATGGKIKIFGGDPEADREIQRKGAETVNAANAQRRTCKEILEEIAKRKAPKEFIEEMELDEGTTCLEAANYAQALRAIKGDTKAMEYIRDTMGEKPTEKIDASIAALTPEDQELINRVAARIKDS